MPKLIDYYPLVKITAVTKRCDMADEVWNWRRAYVGMHGDLDIYVSEFKFPGKIFLRFKSRDNDFLTTSYGNYTIQGNTVTMTTLHSIYEFEILRRREVIA